MLKCLMKYEWVKLRRDTLPVGKGIMGAWAKIAARAAFRKGHAFYCGYPCVRCWSRMSCSASV